jgi:uncharacterized protein
LRRPQVKLRLSSLLATLVFACCAQAAPAARDRQAIGEAAALDAALARGDARRAEGIETRIRALPAGTMKKLEQAKEGSAGAAFAAGLFLSRGLLAARDGGRACVYFARAAAQGHTAAAYHAALCLLAKDPAKAAKLMQSAAARHHPAAQEAIGRACLEQRGERNLDCAVRNLAASAKAGRPSAQSLFAWMHVMGIGVDREPITALALYLLAAGKGDLAAQNNLGELYETGADPGLEKDPHRAALWYESAARSGFGPAQYNLGRLYVAGRGVEYDAVAARFWLHLAEERGVANAAELLLRLDAGPDKSQR